MNADDSQGVENASDDTRSRDGAVDSELGELSGGRTGAVASVLAEDFDVWQAMGGVRGLAETLVPALAFIVIYLATHSLSAAALAPLLASLAAVGVRAVQKIDLVPALSGLLAVGLSALWAYRSGQAENYFTLGLLTNAAYLTVLLLSMLARWPAMGLVLGFLRGDATGWRNGPHADEEASRHTRRRYWQITWLWAGLFALRIAVQLPLLLAGAVTALGIARIAMGPFLFAFVAWLTWMMVRPLPPVPAQETDRAGEADRAGGEPTADEDAPKA